MSETFAHSSVTAVSMYCFVAGFLLGGMFLTIVFSD